MASVRLLEYPALTLEASLAWRFTRVMSITLFAEKRLLPYKKRHRGRGRHSVRASSFGIALIAAGIAGIILGLVGVHTGNPTVGEQKWYWLVSAISLLPLLIGFSLFRSS
jgi:hypothetical protein